MLAQFQFFLCGLLTNSNTVALLGNLFPFRTRISNHNTTILSPSSLQDPQPTSRSNSTPAAPPLPAPNTCPQSDIHAIHSRLSARPLFPTPHQHRSVLRNSIDSRIPATNAAGAIGAGDRDGSRKAAGARHGPIRG